MGAPPSAPPQGVPQQGAVMMVYGLNHEKMNCDRLFNLLCLFGNVVRVCIYDFHITYMSHICIIEIDI